MGFLLLNALVSQKEPKLALSGYSGRLSSLLVLTQCPVTKKSSNIPFCYNFHLLGGGISFCFNSHSLVQPGSELSVYLGGLVRLHSIPLFSLHDLYVRMHCLPTRLSVPCHISAQGIEH